MYQSLIPQTSATNQLYTNRRQFLRFLDRLHCLKMLWYEHVVQLLCFYPPTASFRALYEILFPSPKPELLLARPTMLLTVAEHAEDWGILICLWLTCDWILLVKWLNLHASSTRKNRLFCSNSAWTPLICSKSARYPKKFRPFGPYLFSQIKKAAWACPPKTN